MAFKKKETTVATISVSYQDCPAKTFDSPNGTKRLGRSVFNHCEIVGHVAKELIKRSLVSHLFPTGSAFTAATHDIGKVSPTFYSKLHQSCGLSGLKGINPEIERDWGGHAGVSQVTAKALQAPHRIPAILGQHHGFSPNVIGRSATGEVFGGLTWHKEREKLVEALKAALNESWPQVESTTTARLLAGLTSVADWIGSSQIFDNPTQEWKTKITQALDQSGFIRPEYKTGLTFEQVFDFSPRPIQTLLLEQVSRSGVYVLEAPMGLGKTEAALYAAYQLVSTGKASGIYFALPTQLTSNKIYERFNVFLERILSDTCNHRSLLLHANAWLLDTEMGEEGRPGGAWFNQAKRGLLAPFAVGTIDQALMAVMNVKHGFVRAFGLAGKVVILDEVHSYDAYTGTIMDALIKMLREIDCTVIILSATLTQERRQALLNTPTQSMAYPLITSLPHKTQKITEIAPPTTDSQHSVAVLLQENDPLAVEEALIRAEQGQQVLWIENTVNEAQERYLQLAARAQSLGIGCGLLHSRFTFTDRQAIESKWVNLFGKEGWIDNQRQQQGRILIGTQVLEQSLDIDADFLVSRFAPTDMLLQRIGRLWRHSDTPRNDCAKQEAWLLAPELKKAVGEPASAFGPSAYVYSPYILCRSLEAWQGVQQVSLPSDIRTLIEETHQGRVEQGCMEKWLHELKVGSRYRAGLETLQQLARLGLAQDGNTLPESKAQTRYSESDSFEVLLLRSIHHDNESKTGVLTLLSGEQVRLHLNRAKIDRYQWREITAKLMRQTVYVHPKDAPSPVSRSTLMRFGLQHCFYLGDPMWSQDESLLRIALVDDTDTLNGIESLRAHDKHSIEYRPDLGYRIIKK